MSDAVAARPAPYAMTAADWGAIAFLAAIWGGSFVFIEVLLEHFGPFTVANGRIVVAALGLWVACLLRGVTPSMTPAAWGRYAVGGLFGAAAPFLFYAWAQGALTSGETAIVNAMTPIMTVIVSHAWIGGERATPLKAAGVLVGFGGVALLVSPGASTAAGGGLALLIAQLIALCAPICYAIATNYSRVFKGEDPIATATGTLTAAALIGLPSVLLFDGAPAIPTLGALGALLGLGLVSTALAYKILFTVLPRVGPTNFTTVTFLVPLSTFALAAIFLGERPSASDLLAMAVIFLGLILVDGRLPRRLLATLRA